MIKDVASALFGGIWDLMVQTDYPGVGVSVASVFISFLLIRLSITVFRYLSGFGASSGDYGRAATSYEKYKSRKLRDE